METNTTTLEGLDEVTAQDYFRFFNRLPVVVVRSKRNKFVKSGPYMFGVFNSTAFCATKNNEEGSVAQYYLAKDARKVVFAEYAKK